MIFVSNTQASLSVFDINIKESNTKINGVDSLVDITIHYSSEITDTEHPLYNTNLYDKIIPNTTLLVGRRYLPVNLNDDFYFFKVRSKSILTDVNNVRTIKLTITSKYEDIKSDELTSPQSPSVDGIYFICNNNIDLGLHFIHDLNNTYSLNNSVSDVLYTYKDSNLYSLINSNVITSNDIFQLYNEGDLYNYLLKIEKFDTPIGNTFDNIKNIYGALTFDYYTIKFMLENTEPIEYLNSGDLFF